MSTFVVASGKVASEVTVRTVGEDNKKVAGFRIDAGPGFYSVDAWTTVADVAEKLAEGTHIIVNGRLNTRTFDGKNGKQTVVSIVASSIEVVGAVTAAARPAASADDSMFSD